ncbi:PUA domain-containing protein, partial [Bifidobacterium longum]|uniref:PUA domain-containing protein n=1 Tax=Bifidobacterium longum TaxID=216816 RepID=UPI000D57C1F6
RGGGFAAAPRGRVGVGGGAGRAVRGGRASRLAAGAREVHGDFSAGDPVWIDAESGEHLARGLAGFDSEEIPQMLGRNTAQLKRFLGPQYAHPLVHRDNLVLV